MISSRKFYRTSILIAFAAVVLAAGCAKKPVQPATPPSPPPAPAQPTVTLQAAPSSIQKRESSTLSWSSTNATQMSIDPGIGTVAPEGSTKVTPGSSTIYTITATGPGGSANATASVDVAQPTPPTLPPPGPTIEELFLRDVRDAYFDYNKADIRPDARDALAKTADFLRNYPQVRVTIEGQCDERGSTEYNLVLGDRRAVAARQYLTSLGISADRLSTVSFGKEKPVCTESNEDCWQRNRRGHFVMAK
ncbi:MAG TPA: peptidoglycan-associated lipoprotein Pal [Candidatus Acidoferrales bacterium]|nr:peptidoglycan-associated lipoprotein Pal [Candidatus Acidoferrales bacterium]